MRGRKRVTKRGHERPGGEHEIGFRLGKRLGQLGVHLCRILPEFAHVAEDGDAPAALAGRGLPEKRDCRAHGRRIGIVAFVDEERGAALSGK